MDIESLFDSCKSYVNAQAAYYGGDQKLQKNPARFLPSVTLSRQAGARAVTIGQKVIELLQAKVSPEQPNWTLFNDNLLERVIKDHNLPGRIDRFMPEDKVSQMDSIIGEILGLHPSLDTLYHKMAETIYRLARAGHVIIVGRGGNFVTADLLNVVHVRLVGSFEKRVDFIKETHRLSQAEAEKWVHDRDKERARYIRKNFEANIDDPGHYNLVINTDHFSDEMAARIIIEALFTTKENLS